ncbi:tyrosine-protein phosphatase non-receptor type 13-like [Schistocerca cancellata]|uniref:tyrosine-protein phosphatase non-receptor type 13-like n=1 Tax=Schistocerca cancellata TaxID=274614 RepID=UPI0021175788|nr:tyrosine-protein phosphatase non-receptor type 13-like [Schistocerca cancellata]
MLVQSPRWTDHSLGPKAPPAHANGCGGCDVGGGEAMGSSASRQPAGLAGRRAHSSGSLPRTAAAATAAGAASAAGPAPGARGRSCGGGGGGRSGKLCKDRAALCGSLPNHLDCNDASNGLDQGYGSERSPDDEEDDDDEEEEEEEEEEEGEEATCHCATYPFLNTDSAFEVQLVKGSRGLGLSVCGGADSAERWPGLVRVKRLFPQQPAWLCGRLQPGDILLAANGVSLVGLTDYQALEVLRRTPSRVSLRVVRPPGSLVPVPPPAPGQPPPPPRRDAHLSQQQLLPPPPSHADDSSREFDIVLTKVNRSLGFTLRKEDESVLGHYVRALVREPALSDGRIRPGDKIVAVNDVDISPMSHEEAVMFLRQCGDVVKLRLYRDESQTPVSALSPTEEEKPFKPKPLLRKEARDMLTDLAVRKMSPGESSYSGSRLRRVSADSSPCSSPRRRHLTRSSPSENKAATLERMPAGQKYMVSSQSQTSTSDSSEEHSQNNSNTLTCSSSADADADSTRARGHASSFSSTAGSVGEPVKPLRPNFLDLCGAVGSLTPQTRKPRLVFGSSGEAEWEEDEGDPPPEPAPGSPCPRYSSSCCSSSGGGDIMPLATDSVEPVSMPPLSSTSSTSTAFSYRNPAYQSAVDATGHRNQSDRAGTGTSGAGAGGLLKWKGVVFTPEDGNGPTNGLHCLPEAERAPDAHLPADYEPGDQIFMVELTRGWNSRLGFSLQGNGQHTYISAIYADSVAAKDGRLQAGDRVLMVNDENVETMSTADVIDLLRKIRGTIGITVLRKHKQELTTPTT